MPELLAFMVAHFALPVAYMAAAITGFAVVVSFVMIAVKSFYWQ